MNHSALQGVLTFSGTRSRSALIKYYVAYIIFGMIAAATLFGNLGPDLAIHTAALGNGSSIVITETQTLSSGAMAMVFLSALSILLMAVSQLAVTTQRVRDTGASPWLVLLTFVPVVGFIYWIALFFIGTSRD